MWTARHFYAPAANAGAIFPVETNQTRVLTAGNLATAGIVRYLVTTIAASTGGHRRNVASTAWGDLL